MLKKRLSTPRAATVIVLAAVVALSVTVAPSIAASFLTPKAASQKFVTKTSGEDLPDQIGGVEEIPEQIGCLELPEQESGGQHLRRQKRRGRCRRSVGIAASTTLFSVNSSTAGYIPTAFTSFATKANVSSARDHVLGDRQLHPPGESTDRRPGLPDQILVDGQTTGKVELRAGDGRRHLDQTGRGPRPHDHPDDRARQRRSHRLDPVRGCLGPELPAENLEPCRPGLPAGRRRRRNDARLRPPRPRTSSRRSSQRKRPRPGGDAAFFMRLGETRSG